MNFYKHHLGDYATRTQHLSLLEHGAYRLMLDAYYIAEKPLPADKARLYLIVRAGSAAERRAVDGILTEYFNEQADGWHNERADAEIVAYQAQADTNRRIARQRTVKRTVNESLNEQTTNDSPNPEPRTKNQEPKEERTRKKRATQSPLPEGFEISERVKAWGKEKGYTRLEAHFENFIGKCRAKGYTYVDWDEGFMGAVRDDWAELRKVNGHSVQSWQTSNAGIEAKGRELGITARGGESYRDYASRITEAMNG